MESKKKTTKGYRISKNDFPDFPSQPDEVVWVKLSSIWWPGQLVKKEEWPEECLTMKKIPIAVVKFFQEDEIFEYVKMPNNIHKYNCERKHEFIRKGIELHRGKQEYMKNFPGDVQKAEILTGGDPKIIESTAVLEKPRKSNEWAEIFSKGSKQKRTPMKSTPSPARSRETTPKPTKVYETHTLVSPVPLTPPISTDSQKYKCNLCNFSTERIFLMMNHSKSHSSATIYSPGLATSTSTPQRLEKMAYNQTPVAKTQKEATPEKIDSDSEPEVEPPVSKTRSKRRAPVRVIATPLKRTRKGEKKLQKIATPIKSACPIKETPTKPTKKQEPELRKEILADWLDEDLEEEKTDPINVPEKEPEVQPSTSQQMEQPKIQRIRNIPKKQRDYLVDLGDTKVDESKTCFDFKEDEVSEVQELRKKGNQKSSDENASVKETEASGKNIENLNAEIENIMNETKVPEIPLGLDSNKLYKENELDKRNLPPKERNKRIFKSKTRKMTKEEEILQKQEEILPPVTISPCHDPPVVQPEIKTDHLLQIPKKKHLRSMKANLEIPDIPSAPAIPEIVQKLVKHETRLPKKRKTSPIEEKIEPDTIVIPSLLEDPGKSRVRKTPEKPKQKIKTTAAQPIYITRQGFLTDSLTAEIVHDSSQVIITESMVISPPNNWSLAQNEETAQTSTTNSTNTRTTPRKNARELLESELINLPDKIFQTPEKMEEMVKKPIEFLADHIEEIEAKTGETDVEDKMEIDESLKENDVEIIEVADNSVELAEKLEVPEKFAFVEEKIDENQEIVLENLETVQSENQVKEPENENVIENLDCEIKDLEKPAEPELIAKSPAQEPVITETYDLKIVEEENKDFIEDSQKSPVIENQNLSEVLGETEELLNDTNEIMKDENYDPESLQKSHDEEVIEEKLDMEVIEIEKNKDETEIEDEKEEVKEIEDEKEEEKELEDEKEELMETGEDKVEGKYDNEMKDEKEIVVKENEEEKGKTIDKKEEERERGEEEKEYEVEREATVNETVENNDRSELETKYSELKEAEEPESLKIEENEEEELEIFEESEKTSNEIEIIEETEEKSNELEIVEETEKDEETSKQKEIVEEQEKEKNEFENVQGVKPEEMEVEVEIKESVLEDLKKSEEEIPETSQNEEEEAAQRKFAFDTNDFMEESDKADSDFEETEKIQNLLENMDDSQDSNSINLVKQLETPMTFKSMLMPEKSSIMLEQETENPEKSTESNESPANIEETKKKEKKLGKRKQVLANVTPEKLELMTKEGMIKEVAGKKQLTEKAHRKMKEQMRSKKRRLQEVLNDSIEKITEPEHLEEQEELGGSSKKLDSSKEDQEMEGSRIKQQKLDDPGEEECTKEEELIEESVEFDGEEKDDANTSGTSEDQIFAVGAETFGGPASCFYLCINKNGAITPIDYQPLYLDSTNQLVPRPDPPDVEPENNNITIINTPNGQQLVLDEQTLYRLAAESGAGDVSDGQQIVLSSDLIASLLNSQDIDPGTTEIIVANNANLADMEAQLVDSTFPPTTGLPPVTAHVSDVTSTSVITPRMATTIAPKISSSTISTAAPSGTIDESLRIIGVTSQSRHIVPTSLELPITVTNPYIADSVNHRKLMEKPLILTEMENVIIEEDSTGNESTN